jgi:hypothetical protein
MPAYPTTYQAVRRWLVNGITEACPTAQVSMGWPGRDIADSWVMVGNVKWTIAQWAAMGARQREERYTVDVVIDCRSAGGSADDAAGLVAELLGPVAAFLRATPQLAEGVTTLVELMPHSAVDYDYPEGWGHQVHMTVSVTARI